MKTILVILTVLYLFQILLVLWIIIEDIGLHEYQTKTFQSKKQFLLNLIPFYWLRDIYRVIQKTSSKIKKYWNSLEK